MSDKKQYLVRATQSRKKWGGVWALGAFITLDWHLLELTEKDYLKSSRNPSLEIKEFDSSTDEDFLSPGQTKFAVNPDKSKYPSILDSILDSTDEDEDEDEDKTDDEPEDIDDPLTAVMRKQENDFGVDTEPEDTDKDQEADVDDIDDLLGD